MRRAILGLVSAAAIAFAACGEDGSQPPTGSGAGGATGQGGAAGGAGGSVEPVCGSANLPLERADLITLSYDDGAASSNVREQNFAITTGATWVFNDETLHEAVRFELAHPARIWGFEVMWSNLPAGIDPTAEIEAGLYGDFGYNGFDFWAPDPLWTGTRCAADIDDSGNTFTSYTFATPITVEHPGLVYVAHLALPGEPTWWFDGSQDGPMDNPCGVFGDCRSAFNLPEADTNQFFNGLSFPFQNDFMVRLHVEYLDDVQPADKNFQPIAGVPTSQHASWADYDGDGDDDLLVSQYLYRNEGDGTFSDVTAAAGLASIPFTGGVFGDYDNDGCLDLLAYVEGYNQRDALFKNDCNGAFVDVTLAAGIVDVQSYEDCGDPNNTASPTAAAAWFDLDADGFLDLYMSNFICWAKETFYIDEVWRNQGDGSFVKLGAPEGFSAQKQPTRCVAPIDHDGDGDIDVLVGNYRLRANQFFENQGNGTVIENAKTIGLAGTLGGLYYGHTIGIAWGDIDNDGDFDQIAANLAHPRFFDFSDKTQILIQDAGSYSDLSGDWAAPFSAAGLRYQETHSVPALADFDQDGNLDLAITCIYDGRPMDFYWGNGDGTFTLDAYHAGLTTENGWGMAVSDYDHDGDQDLYVSGLFQNTLATQGHWLQTKVVGVTANRAAIGATVKVSAGGETFMRYVQGGTGKGGQDSLYLHFGLGAATSVEQIVVSYPGGDQVVYPGPIAVDQRVWLYQDSTVPLAGWLN